MEKKNVGLGLASTLFGVMFFVLAFQIPEKKVQSSSPSMFPKFISCLMIIAGLLLVLREYVQSKHRDSESSAVKIENKGLVFGAIAAMVLYALLMDSVGFVICSVLYLFGSMFMLDRSRSAKEILKKLLISIVLTGVIYYVFAGMFHANLPTGILGG